MVPLVAGRGEVDDRRRTPAVTTHKVESFWDAQCPPLRELGRPGDVWAVPEAAGLAAIAGASPGIENSECLSWRVSRCESCR
jgi:hypothetical protein